MNKKGFTLVEMLLVIAIMAALSTLAINGYSNYRKATLLSLAADNLISQFNELKSKAVYGDSSTEQFDSIKSELSGEDRDFAAQTPKAGCFGMEFFKEGDGFKVSSFSQDFVSLKTWSEDEGWQYQGCGDLNTQGFLKKSLEIDDQVQVSKIVVNNIPVLLNSVVLRFLPPNGELETNLEADFLTVTLQYGLSENYSKDITFNLKNALATY